MLFKVKALKLGARVSLDFDAADVEDAAGQARKQGLTVLEVRQAGLAWQLPFSAARRFPIILFSKELHALLGSGLSLVESLQTLEEKENRPETHKVLSGVLGRLYEGENFSSAVSHYPEAFPTLYVATIRASERTGDLPLALSRYVAYQERLEQVRKKAIAASIYPLLLVVLGGVVALFLLGYVTPRFSAIYEDNLERLPWASRVLMYWGKFVSEHVTEALILLAAIAAALVYAASLPSVKAWFARQAWKLPWLGERLRVFQLTRFYRTVGMLLSGGIPVITALDMAAGLLQTQLRTQLNMALRDIREGKLMSQAMERAGLTTSVAARMLRVGEKSGRMGEMMEAVAAFHDEETSRFMEWFMRLFEPILMAMIGLLIGLIVVLLYMPIFELAGNLG